MAFCFLVKCDFPKLPDAGQGRKPHKLNYMIMVGSPEEERQAEILIKSIREYGGEYSSEPVVLVCSQPSFSPGKNIAKKVQKIINLEMDDSLRKFPFSDKVFACAQVEGMVDNLTDWLMWLNPDALMFSPPGKIPADSGKWVSIRPVHVKNIGSPCNSPINRYWQNIYIKTGVDTTRLWPVESFVDDQMLRPYYNSGCMAFRPEKRILRTWKEVYASMLRDKSTYAFYSSDDYSSIFFHQAVLSSVIISRAGKERINILPPSYSYPLVLQNNVSPGHRIDSVPGISIVLCGGYENLGLLRIAEPFKSWVVSNVK